MKEKSSSKKNFILTAVMMVVLTAFVHRCTAETNSEWEISFLGPDTFWSIETNGVKAGLYIEPISSTNNASINCTPILKNSRTNVLWLYFPPIESRFLMELWDRNGRLVTKTAKGKKLGEPLTKLFRLTTGINIPAGYAGIPPLHPNHTELLGSSAFILQDYFVVTNSGEYHLKFQMNVIWFPPEWKGSRKSTNVPIITLPPIDAEVKVKKS